MHHLTIPFRFAGNEELHLVPDEHRHLDYRLEPRATGQKVTNGRLHIKPVINLDQYRAVALINWVEIAFRMRRGAAHLSDNYKITLGARPRPPRSGRRSRHEAPPTARETLVRLSGTTGPATDKHAAVALVPSAGQAWPSQPLRWS